MGGMIFPLLRQRRSEGVVLIDEVHRAAWDDANRGVERSILKERIGGAHAYLQPRDMAPLSALEQDRLLFLDLALYLFDFGLGDPAGAWTGQKRGLQEWQRRIVANGRGNIHHPAVGDLEVIACVGGLEDAARDVKPGASR